MPPLGVTNDSRREWFSPAKDETVREAAGGALAGGPLREANRQSGE
jgi:hypothetical protein